MKKAILGILTITLLLYLFGGCSQNIAGNSGIITGETTHGDAIDIYSDQLYFIKSLGSSPSMLATES
jgi:hypothetical protein